MGLIPDQVLDMTVEHFMVCARAYKKQQQQLQDLELSNIMTLAYYTGYYSMPSKRRKTDPRKILKKMLSEDARQKKSLDEPESFVEEFMRREERWLKEK